MHQSVGKTQTLTDVLDVARAAALHVSLDREGPAPVAGDALPPFFHQIYFWEARPPAQLGRDGHPALGVGFIPDLGLPRRMWAGGRLTFNAPLIAGEPAEKISTIEAIAEKEGRSGPLAFVTLRHEIRQNGTLCVTEHQDVVYREDPAPDAPAPVPPVAATDEDTCDSKSYNATLLFRYSALTFNGHRIHYDRDYCRDVEGYAGLVVHGPILAQQLMLKAEAELGPLSTFAFRATAPVMDFETVELCRKGQKLWVRGPDGRQCMQAEATPA